MKADADLQKDVVEALQWEPAVNAALISVKVDHAAIALSGAVRSVEERSAAGRAARRVPGVRAMDVQMALSVPGPPKRHPAEGTRPASIFFQRMSH